MLPAPVSVGSDHRAKVIVSGTNADALPGPDISDCVERLPIAPTHADAGRGRRCQIRATGGLEKKQNHTLRQHERSTTNSLWSSRRTRAEADAGRSVYHLSAP
jgi:hypothetical protein